MFNSFEEYLLNEMPVSLQKAANSKDEEKVKQEMEKYLSAVEKSIVKEDQPETYAIRNAKNIQIKDPDENTDFKYMTFTADDSNGNSRKIRISLPKTDDISSIKDFDVFVDDKKVEIPSHAGIEKGASYIQLTIANALSSKDKKQRKKKEKGVELMTAPDPSKFIKDDDKEEKEFKTFNQATEDSSEPKSKAHAKENYSIVLRKLNEKLGEGILKDSTSDKRIIPTVNSIKSKEHGYMTTVTLVVKPNEGVSAERIQAIVKDNLSDVEKYITNIESRINKAPYVQIYIDIFSGKLK
jgi:hypothetical protein